VATYTIGELARTAGVGVETIRFYERRGLLRQPERGDGYRRYPESDVARLRFIRRAKLLGFTLVEITDLLAAAGQGATDDLVAAARQRIEAVDRGIAELGVQRSRLEQLAAECADGDDGCLTLAVAATATDPREPESTPSAGAGTR
jgi:MerR family transcriptional regulator, mercuric resistance operon regulatory protein